VTSIPFIRYALDDKNPKILYGRREARWECFHLSLWRCLSSQPCDSPPARFSFSLSLTAFTLDRSLPLPLGESCISDLALAATFLLSRLRSFPPCSLEDPLALVYHFIDPPSELRHNSQLLIYFTGLYPYVWPFSSAYINTLPNFLSASLVKLNDSDGLTQTISQSPSTLMSRISTYFANFFFLLKQLF